LFNTVGKAVLGEFEKFRGWADKRTRTDVVPSLVDKALGSVRAGTKKKGVELCCMYVEVENGGEGVVVSSTFLSVDVH
jgi:hypothetical protein